MIPPSFEYLRAGTVAEAVALLEQHGDDAKILSGGQSLIPMMKLRIARPAWLIDINHIPGLTHIREESGFLKIGALVRESELESSELIRTKYPIIHETSCVIADPLVRNAATIGGNLAHGDPANDHPATMLSVGAQIVATGPRGERTIPIEEFFVSIFTTALEHNEILTEIRVPIPRAHSGGAYRKLERKVGDFATAAVAAQVTLEPGGACRHVGIGLTNVGGTPIKARKAEDYLRGKKPGAAEIGEAAALAASEAQPSSDLRGPAEYKRALVKELAARALTTAVERAGR